MEKFEDLEIVCVNDQGNENCEGTFIFAARDQEFFSRKGFPEPKRCKGCVAMKKLNRRNGNNK